MIDSSTSPQHSLLSRAGCALSGTLVAPGDKSISHRALILGALASGTTKIDGLLESDDVLATAQAVAELGATIARDDAGSWLVTGCNGQFVDTNPSLDLGNSGTGARLLMGAIAGAGGHATIIGDDSLSSRPMARVLTPLTDMGLQSRSNQGRLPVELRPSVLAGREITPKIASAQVKSAILLAGLGARGDTHVYEPRPTRDHTERMLPLFGGHLDIEPSGDGIRMSLPGEQALSAAILRVPGDPSSAAFATIAALIVPGSQITIKGVMNNPGRSGLYDVLRRMGADMTVRPAGQEAGEDLIDIEIATSAMCGVAVDAKIAPSMIDEYPVLAVAAAFATGTTRFCGLSELRAKESDRLAATHALLTRNGVRAAIEGDDLIIEGCGPSGVTGGGVVQAHGDHRLAMSALVMGLASNQPVSTDSAAMIATSYPGFVRDMRALGADMGST